MNPEVNEEVEDLLREVIDAVVVQEGGAIEDHVRVSEEFSQSVRRFPGFESSYHTVHFHNLDSVADLGGFYSTGSGFCDQRRVFGCSS
mgnify:CR=1 FL=1